MVAALALKANQATTCGLATKSTTAYAYVHFSLKAKQADMTTSLPLNANQATTYTKTEVDNTLALQAIRATTYTMTQVDNELALKANRATTYTKAEVDTAIYPQSTTTA